MVVENLLPAQAGWRPWPMVMRWCRRCGVGPPEAFYNSRGLCNVCHKKLRARHGPTWDTDWEQRHWGCKPTGHVGLVIQGVCGPRCGPVRNPGCLCGGPGGIGLPMQEWRAKLGNRAARALMDGDLVESLDAWDDLPPEISTHVPLLLSKPVQWLTDQIGRGSAHRIIAERGEAGAIAEAARIATAALYRWWASSPGVPGPGTVFVTTKGSVAIIHRASTARHAATMLWGARGDVGELVWAQTDGTDQTPASLDVSEVSNTPAKIAPPVQISADDSRKLSTEVLTVLAQVKRRVSAPLGDLAVAAGLGRPQVWVTGREWELGWSVDKDWLAMFGTLGSVHVKVIWSHVDGLDEAMAQLDTAPWREFFVATARRRES